jgi:hypothetical protein
MLTIANQLFVLEQEQARREAKRKRKDKPVYDPVRAGRMKELEAITGELQGIYESIKAIEDDALAAYYAQDAAAPMWKHDDLPPLQARFDALLLLLLAKQSAQPHRVVVGLMGNRAFGCELAAAYRAIAEKHSYSIEACWYAPHGAEQFRRHPIADLAKYLAAPDNSAIGIGLAFNGAYAGLRLAPERGIHGFVNKTGAKAECCIVETTDEALGKYVPVARRQWPVDISPNTARRMYYLETGMLRDDALESELRWTGRDLGPAIAEAVERQLRQAAWAGIDA